MPVGVSEIMPKLLQKKTLPKSYTVYIFVLHTKLAFRHATFFKKKIADMCIYFAG